MVAAVEDRPEVNVAAGGKEVIWPRRVREWAMMEILEYFVEPPGELWVRLRNGTRRRATDPETERFLGFRPRMALQVAWARPSG